jgi:hypothetical protein
MVNFLFGAELCDQHARLSSFVADEESVSFFSFVNGGDGEEVHKEVHFEKSQSLREAADTSL